VVHDLANDLAAICVRIDLMLDTVTSGVHIDSSELVEDLSLLRRASSQATERVQVLSRGIRESDLPAVAEQEESS